MRVKSFAVASLLISFAMAQAQQNNTARKFIKEDAPVIAITHVLLLDGTGAPPQPDRTVVFDHGKIYAVGASSSTQTPAGAKVIDGTGKTLLPGLVGMHEHLFYTGAGGRIFIEQPFSFPQLYLASGVTTARTTGTIEPYTDINVKKEVDAGELVGPEFFLSTPYLDGRPTLIPQLHEVSGPEEAREFVRYWHSVGFTSVKAYTSISPEELKAGIDEAHTLGMKVTGHLCSVGYEQAAALGIDNLEHGPFGAPDSDLYPGKLPGQCTPHYGEIFVKIVKEADPGGPEARKTIDTLVAHHVAITSTLSVFEGGSTPPMSNLLLHARDLMAPENWSSIMTSRAAAAEEDDLIQTDVKKEMAFERAFAKAGGTLLAGCDPTGDGHTLAGLGDQREMELLMQAGFSPAEAVKIYTLNGAQFLGIAERAGSVAPGKQADLVLLQGDLTKEPTSIERPVIVFKNGVGYDSQAIYSSLSGQVGLH